MGLQIKKTALAVIALGLSGVASAAMYTPAPAPTPVCNPTNVTVPCEMSAWDLGVEAIYVQPTSGPNWIYAQSFSQPAIDSLYDRQDFNPDYIWGWRLEGSYHFGTGNDVNVNWMHFNHHNDSDIVSDAGTLFTPFINFDEDYPGNELAGNISNKFDQVNFEFGQVADYGHNYNVRFHFGFQYARIDVSEAVAALTSDEAFTYGYNDDSRFNGIGLRGGLDTGYDFGNGFGIEGKAAMALLVGDIKHDTNLVEFDDGDLDVYTWSGSRRQVVPEIEASADVKYTHNLANGDISFYLGWRFVNYFDVIETLYETTSHGNRHVDQSEVRNETNNFAFQGPMAGIKWVGNV